MTDFTVRRPQTGQWDSAFTLVEVLISMAIMAFVALSIGMVMMRLSVSSSSVSLQNRQALEIEEVFQDLRNNIQRANRIDSTSHSNKLLMTIVNDDGTSSLVGYRITTVSGKQVLQTSTDGGTTWSSPYTLAADTTYRIETGEFLYCGFGNNCTRLTDSNSNGNFDVGTDAAALATGYSGTALSRPTEATKILLNNFRFNRDVGNPQVVRQMPNTFARIQSPRVYNGSVAALNSFATNSTAGQVRGFPSTFTVRGVGYDERTETLWVVGTPPSGNHRIYRMQRDGVPVVTAGLASTVSSSFDTGVSGNRIDDIALEEDGTTAILINSASDLLYRVNTTTGAVSTTLNLVSACGFTTGTVRGVAYDPNSSTDLYLIGTVSGSVRILRRNKTTCAAVSSWAVPAGLTSPNGLAIDPVKGDLFTIQNSVSTAPTTLTVYDVDLSSPTTATTFAIGLSSIGSTAPSGTGNYWGLEFDIANNRLFLSSTTDNAIYEVVPTRSISPTQ